MGDYPDWLRAIALLGQDGSNYRILACDANGQLYILAVGQDDTSATRILRTDSNGNLITLLQGASGNTVVVDANGYLTAVLKGEYAGALHTMAVDADGRLESFVLDSEDQWGSVLRVGNAELAARLGNLRTWDWRGDTVWATDFSTGIQPFAATAYGTGSSIKITPEYALSGGYSVKMTCGSDGLHKTLLVGYFDTPATSRIGVEIAWSSGDAIQQMIIRINRYYNGKRYLGAFRYNSNGQKADYYSASGTWINIGNLIYGPTAGLFHHMKLVVDGAGNYVRGIAADGEFDISSYSQYYLGTGAYDTVEVDIEAEGRAGGNDVVYLDRVILTANEPA